MLVIMYLDRSLVYTKPKQSFHLMHLEQWQWQEMWELNFYFYDIFLCVCFFFFFAFTSYSFYVEQEFENNSASSQVFWLLKESELTPSNANILDGRYAVFGYVTENEDYLADLKVGDVIESIQVVSGLDNLVNPSYKIAG